MSLVHSDTLASTCVTHTHINIFRYTFCLSGCYRETNKGRKGERFLLVIVFVFQEHDVFSADLEPGGIRKVPDDVVLVAVMIAIVIAVDLDTDDYLSTSELLILHTGAGAKRVRRKGRASRV